MTNQQLIQQIRDAVRATADQGKASINVVDLDRFLDQFAKMLPNDGSELTEFQREKVRAHFEEYLANQQKIHEGFMEMFRSVITAGQKAVKSALLINGGAAAALLAFVGHLATAPGPARFTVPRLAAPLSLYVLGLLMTAMSFGSTYVAQTGYYRQKNKAGDIFNGISIALIIGSYIVFAVASYTAFSVFRSM